LEFQLNTSASSTQELQLKNFIEKDLRLFLKRDDLIHPFISGNKWRKLKYILYAARSKGKSSLVTFGGAFSNHLLAVACAGAIFKFRTTAFVRGEEIEIRNPVLKMCHLFGMRLIFISRGNYKQKDKVFDKYFGDEEDYYLIPEGGSCMEALEGVGELIDELPFEFDYIFTSSGTGGTLAGLAKGIYDRQWNCEVNGIAVIQGAEYLNSEIRNWIGDIPYRLHTEYHRGGYAKTDNELIVFARNFIRETGIVIEPVYTAKMLIGLNQLVSKNYFRKGSKILCLHTGGVWGGNGLLF